MSLATVQNCKDYMRVETTAEDALIATLLTEAIGGIEAACGKSLTTETVTWYDNATTLRMWNTVTNLLLGYVPVDGSTIVVKDQAGVTVPSAAYLVRQDLTMLMGVPGTAFANGPYSITCTAGLGTAPSYTARWLPFINSLIIDYVAMLYQQRTPGASSEGASGSRVDYVIEPESGLPARIARGVRLLRGVIA